MNILITPESRLGDLIQYLASVVAGL